MDRELNTGRLEQAMADAGLSQTAIADQLGVTRAAVSKWLTGKSFPRPSELLRLAKLVKLGYAELVDTTKSAAAEPVVAFRKRAGTKTTPAHVDQAKEMGRLLAPLVKHLPFDQFLSPSRLKNPSPEYHYLQSLAADVRKDLKLDPVGKIDFEDLIGKFKQLQAVLIPVMWGQKDRHENALHIYLPESKTTWIYLNLDSHLHDFKFWMAHELGHVLAVDLLTPETLDQAEDFSDAFAGALLFPEPAAKEVYGKYHKARNDSARIAVLCDTARDYVISPNTVCKQVQAYAAAYDLGFEKIPDRVFYAALTEFNRTHPLVSAILFDDKKPSADHFMRICLQEFKTPIFTAIEGYLKEAPRSDALVSRILDVSLLDGKELHRALK